MAHHLLAWSVVLLRRRRVSRWAFASQLPRFLSGAAAGGPPFAPNAFWRRRPWRRLLVSSFSLFLRLGRPSLRRVGGVRWYGCAPRCASLEQCSVQHTATASGGTAVAPQRKVLFKYGSLWCQIAHARLIRLVFCPQRPASGLLVSYMPLARLFLQSYGNAAFAGATR